MKFTNHLQNASNDSSHGNINPMVGHSHEKKFPYVVNYEEIIAENDVIKSLPQHVLKMIVKREAELAGLNIPFKMSDSVWEKYIEYSQDNFVETLRMILDSAAIAIDLHRQSESTSSEIQFSFFHSIILDGKVKIQRGSLVMVETYSHDASYYLIKL